MRPPRRSLVRAYTPSRGLLHVGFRFALPQYRTQRGKEREDGCSVVDVCVVHSVLGRCIYGSNLWLGFLRACLGRRKDRGSDLRRAENSVEIYVEKVIKEGFLLYKLLGRPCSEEAPVAFRDESRMIADEHSRLSSSQMKTFGLKEK
ncbi:hypothetical protein OPV22_018122 [Ensete ventricosum]|uniref:Uncharacterized protein n=1 Tax=Ensete ventricosum TaxID=4639 RepID=A0AAV8R2J8_ENSVE|nr:hypothetical protein OPV22_018122 [Ensete ventricosum]